MDLAAGGCARFPWCRTDHTTATTDWHGTHIGQWQIGAVAVNIRIGQSDPHEPVVHAAFVRNDGKHRVLELDAGQARTASDVLDFFAPSAADDISEAAEMLSRAGDTIDPEHERETPW
jgi:hypothetical protein